MEQQTWAEKLKDFIGGIAWKVFLWSIGMTDKEYIRRIVEESLFEEGDNDASF